MRKAILLVLSGLSMPFALSAQRPEWSVTIAAVGSRPQTIEATNGVLGKVQKELESAGNVTITGERFSGLRSEISNKQVFDSATRQGADGVAVLQFEPAESETKGYLYLWTASPHKQPVGQYTVFVETVDLGDTQSTHTSTLRLAAFIRQAASEGKEVAIELHMMTKPPEAFFRVANSASEQTDKQGRRLWVGNRPEGITTVRVYKEPEWEETTRDIQVKKPADGQLAFYSLSVELKRKKGGKTPSN